LGKSLANARHQEISGEKNTEELALGIKKQCATVLLHEDCSHFRLRRIGFRQTMIENFDSAMYILTYGLPKTLRYFNMAMPPLLFWPEVKKPSPVLHLG